MQQSVDPAPALVFDAAILRIANLLPQGQDDRKDRDEGCDEPSCKAVENGMIEKSTPSVF